MARIYTNFAKSTLASGISDVATSVTVGAGEGALFPAAGAGSTFDAVIYNTSGLREIVSCTSRTGDVLTIVRGQQGTTALAWLASDKIGHRFTAAALNSILFADDLQENTPSWCGTAGGTADALTLTPSPAVTAMVAGHKFIFKAGSSANTGAATMAVSGLSTFALQNNGAALAAGDIEANKWYEVLYDGAAGQLKKYGVPVAAAIGQCRLSRASSTSLLLSPQNGNLLTVNGVNCTIPDAGVTLAAAPAAANTSYYIYAVATAGAISSLEASTTGWAVSTAAGNKGTPIKSGDETRTLVGMARGNASTQWADPTVEIGVINYWNRRNLDLTKAFTAGRPYASSSWGEPNTEIRVGFLTWGDEAVIASASGAITATTAGSSYSTSVGVDGTTPEDGGCTSNNAAAGQAGSVHPIACGTHKTLSEGYHYITLLANHGGGASGTYAGAASGNVRCAVRAIVRG